MSRSVDQFIRQLDVLASPATMNAIKREVANEGLREIARQFSSETDPYGQIWPDVTPHKGHRSILNDTGALRGSFTAYPTAGGVLFGSSVPYAAVQNRRRLMLPNASRGLGTSWKRIVQDAFTKSVREAVKL